MAWLTLHMWLLLLGAFLLGLLMGRWIWRYHHKEALEATISDNSVPETEPTSVFPLSATPFSSEQSTSSSPKSIMSAASKEAAGVESKPDNIVDQDTYQPVLFSGPFEGPADDLKKIKGIGPAIEKTLHDVGIFYFSQIATWSEEEAQWVNGKLKFAGRIEREQWVDQAKVLRDGGQTEFARRYDKGRTPSSYEASNKNDDV